MQLWDVVNDQGAVDLVRAIADPRQAAEEFSNTHTAITPQTTSLCLSSGSGTLQRVPVQIDNGVSEALASSKGA